MRQPSINASNETASSSFAIYATKAHYLYQKGLCIPIYVNLAISLPPQVLEDIDGSKKLIPNGNMPWVHVEDVAAARVAAAEAEAASGRYMLIAWWGHLPDMCASVVAQFP